jgi:hypothetical protein
MKNLNLNKANETLLKMTNNMAAAKAIRANTVNVVIDATLEYCKENKETFSTKKNAIADFIKRAMDDKSADNYTKRAVKVAKYILVDGHKMKKEELSLAQMEQLCHFKVNIVNALMELSGDDYLIAVKELIKLAKVETKATKFSAKKAQNI